MFWRKKKKPTTINTETLHPFRIKKMLFVDEEQKKYPYTLHGVSIGALVAVKDGQREPDDSRFKTSIVKVVDIQITQEEESPEPEVYRLRTMKIFCETVFSESTGDYRESLNTETQKPKKRKKA